MSNILIAWELGDSFGHVTRCIMIATALLKKGHNVTVALSNVKLVTYNNLPKGLNIIQSPVSLGIKSEQREIVNHSDILLTCGFSSALDIASRLFAWDGIISLTKPDLIVVDYAPTATIAAFNNDIPIVTVGNGFVQPPKNDYPWDSIIIWKDVPKELLLQRDKELDNAINEAQQILGYEKITLREVYAHYHDTLIIDYLKELDHYMPNNRDVIYTLPIIPTMSLPKVEWHNIPDAKKILIYLRADISGVDLIIDVVSMLRLALSIDVICVCPGFNEELAKKHKTRAFRIYTEPVDFQTLLPNADLLIGYASSGLVTEALINGVPMLMKPRFTEQAMLAYRVAQIGCGILTLADDRANINQYLIALLTDPYYKNNAQALKTKYATARPGKEVIIEFIEKQLHAQS